MRLPGFLADQACKHDQGEARGDNPAQDEDARTQPGRRIIDPIVQHPPHPQFVMHAPATPPDSRHQGCTEQPAQRCRRRERRSWAGLAASFPYRRTSAGPSSVGCRGSIAAGQRATASAIARSTQPEGGAGSGPSARGAAIPTAAGLAPGAQRRRYPIGQYEPARSRRDGRRGGRRGELRAARTFSS